MSNPVEITYSVRFTSGGETRIAVELTGDGLDLISPLPAESETPEWAALDFEKCSHCPLDSEETPSPNPEDGHD